VEQAQGSYRMQRASLIPWLDGSADWTRGRSGITGQTSGRFDVFGALSYEIDFWGRLRRLTEAARAQLLASEEGYKTVYISLVAQVAATYFDLRALDEQLLVATRTYVSRTNSLELTRVKFNDNNGVVSELDVRQAETQVYAAQSSMAQLERAITVTENALSFLLGCNPGPIARGRSLPEQELPESIPAGLPSDLLLRRPDILTVEYQLVAANADIGAARAAYFPSLSLSAALGLQSLQLEDLFSAGASRAWSFSPQIVGPIFRGGRVRAGVQIAEARRTELLAAYERAIQNAFREVEDALVTAAKLREEITIGEAAVAAERRRLALSLDRYENGVSSYFDVLDAERFLFSAELNLIQSRSDLLSALAQLYKALGGGWSPAGQLSSSTLKHVKTSN
jgi:outer membrane protein, multidrug efflux system